MFDCTAASDDIRIILFSTRLNERNYEISTKRDFSGLKAKITLVIVDDKEAINRLN